MMSLLLIALAVHDGGCKGGGVPDIGGCSILGVKDVVMDESWGDSLTQGVASSYLWIYVLAKHDYFILFNRIKYQTI